jgi:hypothetical protein
MKYFDKLTPTYMELKDKEGKYVRVDRLEDWAEDTYGSDYDTKLYPFLRQETFDVHLSMTDSPDDNSADDMIYVTLSDLDKGLIPVENNWYRLQTILDRIDLPNDAIKAFENFQDSFRDFLEALEE